MRQYCRAQLADFLGNPGGWLFWFFWNLRTFRNGLGLQDDFHILQRDNPTGIEFDRNRITLPKSCDDEARHIPQPSAYPETNLPIIPAALVSWFSVTIASRRSPKAMSLSIERIVEI